ncbi:MAG TPA: efflux RND transporter periplasmic adaptor subunit [Kofleriaceae bacterium]|nr:efflux RND transporter periplasmic adaptor subunit [Kofleriaceae bacterium]
MSEAKGEPGRIGAISGQSMDRVVERRPFWRRRGPVVAALLAVAAGATWFFFLRGDGGKSLAVAGSHITIARVTRGRFDDVIEVRGRVTPLRTTYVDTASGGQVEKILVEDGARVTRGQPLVELSNTQLQLDVISREAQITEQLNDLRGLELAQEQTRLVHEREMVEVQYQIKRLTRQMASSERLVGSGVSPRNELDDMKDELAYYQKRLKVQTETRAAADKLQRAQLIQLRTASRQLEKNLEIARKNLENLKVVAPADGQLSAFTLEVGQSLSPGDRIAQIDDPERFKLVADIDEFYLSRVDIGQRADYPTGGKSYQLSVAKIRPQVQNGQFQVELVFEGEAPDSVRRGQTAQIRLQLGQPGEALLVPNAAFYNDTGGTWVFVVSSDHARAVRRAVRLGRRNPNHIEVLDGLSVGEEIVTSPYTNFLEMDRLELTE